MTPSASLPALAAPDADDVLPLRRLRWGLQRKDGRWVISVATRRPVVYASREEALKAAEELRRRRAVLYRVCRAPPNYWL